MARGRRIGFRKHTVWVLPLGIATIILFIAFISVITLYFEREWGKWQFNLFFFFFLSQKQIYVAQ